MFVDFRVYFEQECRLLYEVGLKDSPLRPEYEEKVRDLSILREQMETEGKTKEKSGDSGFVELFNFKYK